MTFHSPTAKQTLPKSCQHPGCEEVFKAPPQSPAAKYCPGHRSRQAEFERARLKAKRKAARA